MRRKKEVIFDLEARKNFHKAPLEVQVKFLEYIEVLEQVGFLVYPDGRKISEGIFEIRVRVKGAWRGFYGYFGKKDIVVLHFFQKKMHKTPKKDLKSAVSKLKYYKNNYEN